MTELAEVFRDYGPQYRAKFGHKMPSRHRRAMRAIERCRTPALGGHIYTSYDFVFVKSLCVGAKARPA